MNPGSDEAVAAGCICPREDNCMGQGWRSGQKDAEGKPLFVTRTDCPLHAPPEGMPVEVELTAPIRTAVITGINPLCLRCGRPMPAPGVLCVAENYGHPCDAGAGAWVR